MDHGRAIAGGDATPRRICGCARYAAAGWKVRCAACGSDNLPAAVTPGCDTHLVEVAA